MAFTESAVCASALCTAKLLGYSERTELLMLEISTFVMGQDLQPFFYGDSFLSY